MGILHKTSMWRSIGPATSRHTSTAQGRLRRAEDVAVVALRDTVTNSNAGLGHLMLNTKLFSGSFKFTCVIREQLLDLALAGEELEGFAGLSVPFILDGKRADQTRPKVFDVDRVLEAVNTMCLTLLVRDEVIRGDNLPPLLHHPLKGSFELGFCPHFASNAMLAILVERLMSQ